MTSLRGNRGNTIERGRNVDRLTPSEERIWKMYKSGQTRMDIAEQLSLSKNTVDRRLYTIKEKLAAGGEQ